MTYSPLQKFESTFKSFAADRLSISLDSFSEIAASLQQALTVWPSLNVFFKMNPKFARLEGDYRSSKLKPGGGDSRNSQQRKFVLHACLTKWKDILAKL
jgi:hypothetical protein